MAAPSTRNLTILLTDIKGFTDKTSHRSRADIQRLLDEHRDVVLPVLQQRGGRLVKTIGDAFLVTFESPTDAVLAGVAAQEALARRNAPLPAEDRIEIRIAINAGEVNLVEGDVYGEPVNIASRIESVTEAGEVYFTEAVYLAMNKTEVPSSEIGLLQLKGIPEKIRVYKVRHESPVGVGQAPAPRAAAPASGFAPGEKARLAPAAPVPSAAAPGSPRRPPRWRRAAALALDGLICTIIVGTLLGKEPASLDLSVKLGGKKGAAKAAKAASKEARESVSVELGPTGLAVKDPSSTEVLFDDGKGMRVTQTRESPRKRLEKRTFALIWFLYGLLFLRWSGATPGKLALKLKVVSVDGAPLEKRQRIVRSAVSVLSGACVMLGYVWGLFEKDGRGWHDLAAGTRVVAAE